MFARTREAVRTLAALLQGLPELPGMQVGGWVGHVSSSWLHLASATVQSRLP